MQIFSKLADDATAKVTIQMSNVEYQGLRTFMRTPDEFTSIKFPNGVYLNKVGFGWYKLTTSNDLMVARKLSTALNLISKATERIAEEQKIVITANSIGQNVPFPLGVPFPKPGQMPVVPIVRVPDDKQPEPVKHHSAPVVKRPSNLLAALFSRA